MCAIFSLMYKSRLFVQKKMKYDKAYNFFRYNMRRLKSKSKEFLWNDFRDEDFF